MDIYKKLLKIRKPVLLAVFNGDKIYKLRVLRPNGLCTWVFADEEDVFHMRKAEINGCNLELFNSKSCFIFVEDNLGILSLKTTILNMRRYDNAMNEGIGKAYTTHLIGTIDL